MKSLEQDALKAQMVIAKSKEGKKRGTLDQLTESPSPAPTPSPTPMEGKHNVTKGTPPTAVYTRRRSNNMRRREAV
jgi:protein scribble